MEENKWIKCEDRLPEALEFDWVLVITRISPGEYYRVPHVAELRSGVWYCTEFENPMEETLAVKVTHWQPLPEPPDKEAKE